MSRGPAPEGRSNGRARGRSVRADPSREEREAYRERLPDAIVREVERYNPDVPAVLGLDWGHTNPIAPLLIGGRVSVDPGAGTVTFA